MTDEIRHNVDDDTKARAVCAAALQQWGGMMANVSDIANGRKLGMVYSEAFGAMPGHWRWLARRETPPMDGVM